MRKKESCLVLEGGALRGVYTSGVQGVLHGNQLTFDCLIGTSAGSMNGANFLANQPERSFVIDYHFARDKNFMGLRPLIREKQIFSFTYMFGHVNSKYPLNLEDFLSSPSRFIAVATDSESGQPAFLEKDCCSDMMLALQASSSMPLLSTPVTVDGKQFFDGGPSMPVGYQKAIDDGYRKTILILTRPKGYRKSPHSKLFRLAMKRSFRHSPAFLDTLLHSPQRYNRMMDDIDQLEADGSIFVIRPSEPVSVSRTERNLQKLQNLFLLGRSDAQQKLSSLQDYLHT